MGCVNSKKEEREEGEKGCTYCGKESNEYHDFYPTKKGGYSTFGPEDKIHRACNNCAYKNCQYCGKTLPKFLFINCDLCKKIHCFNNTDMEYTNNSMLLRYDLCDARKCGHKYYF